MGTSAPLLRSVYRSVLRSARRIDENPGLKALLGAADNSSDLCSEARVVLENYMQGRTLYIPDPQSKYSLVDRAREGSVLLRRMGSLDQGLGALRFLNRIIEGGKKQQLLNDQLSPLAAERMPDSRDKVSLAEEPAPGVVLLAHPCLGGWFSRTAVLLVEHNKLGSRGVCLNKPLAVTLKDIKEKALRAIRDAGGSLDFVEVEVEGFGVVKLQTQWSMQLPSSDEPGGQQRAASTKMEQHSCPEDTSSYRQYLEDLQDVRESFEARQSRGDRLHPREQASLRALQRVVGREDPASSQSPSELGTDDDVGVALEHGGRDGHARARAAKSRRSNQRLAHVRPAEGATGSRKCKAAMSKQERKNKDIAEAFISLENNRLSNGGPVSQVPVLHCIPHLGGSHVLEGVFWCEQSKVLLSDLGALDRRKVRFFLGEASWSPGQLEAELKMGSWIMARAPVGTLDLMDQGYWSSFEGASVERQHKDPSFLWEKLMSGLGGEYAIMARMPPWAAAFGNDM